MPSTINLDQTDLTDIDTPESSRGVVPARGTQQLYSSGPGGDATADTKHKTKDASDEQRPRSFPIADSESPQSVSIDHSAAADQRKAKVQ